MRKIGKQLTRTHQTRPSVIGIIFVAITLLSTRLRLSLWHRLYNEMAKRDSNGILLFMNFGYADKEEPATAALLPHEERFRYPIQLYLNTIKGVTLYEKDLLEVGCGRGGGAIFLLRTQQPRQYIGVDLSEQAISWCRNTHTHPNAQWECGRADALPLADASVDVVLNVESSHCYPSMPDFLAEVHRVLRPGGIFAFCDLRLRAELPILEKAFRDSGLMLVSQKTITAQVLHALTLVSKEREEQIAAFVPRFLQAAFRDFAAVKNSILHDKFQADELVYISAQLLKPPIAKSATNDVKALAAPYR